MKMEKSHKIEKKKTQNMDIDVCHQLFDEKSNSKKNNREDKKYKNKFIEARNK